MEGMAMEPMPAKDYNYYLTAIKAANDSADKEALRQIQKQLITRYGLSDDVRSLLGKFKYSV